MSKHTKCDKYGDIKHDYMYIHVPERYRKETNTFMRFSQLICLKVY